MPYILELASKKAFDHITYEIRDSLVGRCLVGFFNDGICHLSFLAQTNDEDIAVKRLQASFPYATITKDKPQSSGKLPLLTLSKYPVPLYVAGTPLQLRVWQELMNIPFGTTQSYKDIAQRCEKPLAVRAVANAIGRNEISFLIPCHRVIGSSRKLTGYRWGVDVKEKLLWFESKRETTDHGNYNLNKR